MEFKYFIKKVMRYNKDVDVELLERAYNFSHTILKDKIRASGEPWINHYVDVAYEVSNLKLDDKSLVASLMHGILNKGADLKEVKKIFGQEITNILENIEKISEIKRAIVEKTSEVDSLRKVLLVASKDLRVLLIKICDKLANLRDLEYLPITERKRIAKEAMEIYAPLAYRLGMGKVKSEIEDLAFRHLDETKYREIESRINLIRKNAESSISKIKRILEKELEKENIKSEVETRVKHIYSIYRKITERAYDLENMMDILGIRIIVRTIDDCYKTLKIIHTNFRPMAVGFKDYIAMPKPNGYQSLHTAVVDEDGKIFEFQIRTEEMHEVAEEGIAAHFSYKNISHEKDFDKKLSWLKQIVEDKISNFDVDLFGDSIFAFTPKGKAVELPNGSSVIDFAYYIHTDLGQHCIGANVNGKFLSLKDKLDNGNIVEILTSKTQKPSREWLKFAKTTKAREKIKHTLKESGKVATRIYSASAEDRKEIGESLIDFDGNKRAKIKLALCCKPIPGDQIVGIKSSDIKLIVHRTNCMDITKTEKKKTKARWLENFEEPVEIIVDAKDRPGLFNEIINSTSKLGFAVSKTKGKMINNTDIECSFMADVKILDKLNFLINRINKIRNVKAVYIKI